MIKAKTLQDLFKRYRRPGDLVFSIFFLIFSLTMAASLSSQTTWASGTKFLAQPAFWPYTAVIVMTFFAVLHLASSMISPMIEGRWREVQFWGRSIEFAGWFMAYVLIVPRAGYLLATIIFTVSLTYRLGYRGSKMLGSAALFGATVVILFKTLLQVKVPGGQVYEFLPTALRSFMLTYF